MARIRSVKPEFWDSEDTGTLSPLAALTYIGLWNIADDDGRGRYQPTTIYAKLHALREGVTPLKTKAALEELVTRGLVVQYKASDGTALFYIPSFTKHQHPNKKLPSKLPPPPEVLPENSGSPTGASPDDSRPVVERECRGRGEGGEKGPTAPHVSASPGGTTGSAGAGVDAATAATATAVAEEAPEDAFDEDLKAFETFTRPERISKLKAFRDLVRQGVSHERIRQAATEWRDWDFYDVVKALQHRRGSPVAEPPPKDRPNPPKAPPGPSRAEVQAKQDAARQAADRRLAEMPAEEIGRWTREAEEAAKAAKVPEVAFKVFVTAHLRSRAAREFGIQGV